MSKECVREAEGCGLPFHLNNTTPSTCCDGFKCVFNQIPDTEGKCKTCVGEGKHCGGFIANPSICCDGLICKLNLIADIGGNCTKQ